MYDVKFLTGDTICEFDKDFPEEEFKSRTFSDWRQVIFYTKLKLHKNELE